MTFKVITKTLINETTNQEKEIILNEDELLSKLTNVTFNKTISIGEFLKKTGNKGDKYTTISTE